MVNFRLGNTPLPDLVGPSLSPMNLNLSGNRQFQSIQGGKLIKGVDPNLVPLNKQSEWRGPDIYLNLEDQLIGNGQVLPENRNFYQGSVAGFNAKNTKQSINLLQDNATRVGIIDNTKDNGGTTTQRAGQSIAFIAGANSSGIFDANLLAKSLNEKADEIQIGSLPFTDFYGLQKDQNNYFAPFIGDVSGRKAMEITKESTDAQLSQAIKNAENNKELKIMAASASFVPMMRSLISKIKDNEIPKDLKVSIIGLDPLLGLSDLNKFLLSEHPGIDTRAAVQKLGLIGPNELKRLKLEDPEKLKEYISKLVQESDENKRKQPIQAQKTASHAEGLTWQGDGIGNQSFSPDLILAADEEFQTLLSEINSLSDDQKKQLNVTVVQAKSDSKTDKKNLEKFQAALPNSKLKAVDSTHNIALVNPEELAKIATEN